MSEKVKSDKIVLNNLLEFDSIKNSKTDNSTMELGQRQLIKFAATNAEEIIKRFPDFIKENQTEIAELEELNNGQRIEVTLRQLNQTLALLKFYREQQQRPAATVPNRWAYICAENSVSIFEILTQLYAAIIAKLPLYYLLCGTGRNYLRTFLAKEFTISNVNETDENPIETKSCVQIIFDSADLMAALHHLNCAAEDKTSPWRIRSCWIQESLREKCLELIKLESNVVVNIDNVADAEKLGADVKQFGSSTLLFGVSRKDIDLPNVIFVNFFRTSKEALTLINADVIKYNQCASIWSENISVALEAANKLSVSNIWINSNGLLDPNVPFSFGDGGLVFGSELGPLQQWAGQTNIDTSAMAKDCYAEVLTDSYSMTKIINNIQFIVSAHAKPRNEWNIFATLLTDFDTDRKRNLIANLAVNKLKTICIPFGTIFAN